MSWSLHKDNCNFSNVSERSMTAKQQGDWIIVGQQGLEGPDMTSGMLTEIISSPWQKGSGDVLDDQIQASFRRWSQKQQLTGVVDELPFINSQNKPAHEQSSYLAQGFQIVSPVAKVNMEPPSQLNWIASSSCARPGRVVLEGQSLLSLSLSSSLRNLESDKLEKISLGDGELRFNGQEMRVSNDLLYGHTGYVESARRMNFVRNSRYLKGAQELLEEFCGVGRGQLKNYRIKNHPAGNPNSPTSYGGEIPGPSSSKIPHPFSPSERTNYQRRKHKLLSMLEEVDARYLRYCQQMRAMEDSFDTIAGGGAAGVYTGLARKAMSRHFRGMKDAIMGEVKACCEALGEKDKICIGLRKGETPRLKMVEHKYRQLKAQQNGGMVESSDQGWRHHRGLPERSVNILRAWLFEHFLDPYPNETDKHVLSRQTGLSKYQVSNWFINARVRLWKPMVEEMYQQECQGEESNGPKPDDNISFEAQTPSPSFSEAPEKDPSQDTRQRKPVVVGASGAYSFATAEIEYQCHIASPGTHAPGAVSLTLGLRRPENAPRMEELSSYH